MRNCLKIDKMKMLNFVLVLVGGGGDLFKEYLNIRSLFLFFF